MSKSNNKSNKLEMPSVLACEKKLVPSDGYMYGTTWNERHDESKRSSVKIIEKSVRGTISNRLTKKQEADPAKLDADIEQPNLQRVDNSSLEEHQDTLILHFTLKVLSGVENPSACNNEEFARKYLQKTRGYIEDYGFKELAKRYATNLANGRFLWRNRVGAEKIEVQVKVLSQEASGIVEQIYTFDALKIGLNNFDSGNNEIEKLSHLIAETLSGKNSFLMLDVTAYAKVGKAQDVYPSEELVLDKGTKPRGEKSKILYQVGEVAAMHSQKIGNAIRTIDTWYNQKDTNYGAIAIEPYGAVTNLGKAFRTPKQKDDFYTLFDSWLQFDDTRSAEEQHYCMAILVRGGVFGKSSDKQKSKDKEEATDE